MKDDRIETVNDQFAQELSGANPVALLIRILKLGSFVNTPMKEGVCDPEGLQQIELKIMMALAGEGRMAGHDITTMTGIPAMSVSRAIASLRKRGWVEDTPDSANRRRRPVRLSAAGIEAYEDLAPALSQLAEQLLGGLSASDRKSFARIADRLNRDMADWISSHHEEVQL